MEEHSIDEEDMEEDQYDSERYVYFTKNAALVRMFSIRSEREEETESQTRMNITDDGYDERNNHGRLGF